jgi:ankyrin repeat protein
MVCSLCKRRRGGLIAFKWRNNPAPWNHPSSQGEFDEDFGDNLHFPQTPSIAKLFLNHGADVNMCTNFGKTPLHTAMERVNGRWWRSCKLWGVGKAIKY